MADVKGEEGLKQNPSGRVVKISVYTPLIL